GHGPAGARVRGRHAPLRAGPGEGPYRRGGDAAGSRRPGAQGGGRLRRPRAARPAAAEPGAHLHEPQRAHGHRPGPVSRATARRRARAAGGGALEARRAARACAARGLLRRAQHRRAVHGARVAAPPTGLNMELDEHLREGVIAVAHAAAAAILEVYERDFDVEQKSDDSPVTAADLAAHRCIVDGLARLTPDIPVLSEESTAIHMAQRHGWNRLWLVDPLDCTRELVKRNGASAVNIAYVQDCVARYGVVQAPVTGITWHGGAGLGAWRRDGAGERGIRVRQPAAAPLRVAASRSHRT